CGSRHFRELNHLLPLPSLDYSAVPTGKVIVSDLDEMDWMTIRERTARPEPRLISLANTTDRLFQWIARHAPPVRAYHVIRDPRDILISSYFHHRDGHWIESPSFFWPDLDAARPVLQALPQEQGILFELEHITAKVLDRQIAPLWWQGRADVLTIKLEDYAR